MATTRAKMRCHSITLQRAAAMKPKYDAIYKKDGYRAAQSVAEADGEELNVPFDQPTVELGAVTGGPGEPEENRAFWSASPQGTVRLTITNPAAAELFELGEEYYVDFTKA